MSKLVARVGSLGSCTGPPCPPEDQDPMVLAAAHEHLAHSYLEEGPVEVEVVAEPMKKDRRRKV